MAIIVLSSHWDIWFYMFIALYQDRFLAYGPEQHPIVLQIGGNNLENLATATQLATPYGYDEINFKWVFSFMLSSFNMIW